MAGLCTFHFYTWIMMKNNRPLATTFIRKDNFLAFVFCAWNGDYNTSFLLSSFHFRCAANSVHTHLLNDEDIFPLKMRREQSSKKGHRNFLKPNGTDEIMQMETFLMWMNSEQKSVYTFFCISRMCVMDGLWRYVSDTFKKMFCFFHST